MKSDSFFKIIFVVFCVFMSACSSTKEIILELENGNGIEEKSNVLFKGHRIGTVSKLSVTGNKLIANIKVESSFVTYKETRFLVERDLFSSSLIAVNPDWGEEYLFTKLDTLYCPVIKGNHERIRDDFIESGMILIDSLRNIITK